MTPFETLMERCCLTLFLASTGKQVLPVGQKSRHKHVTKSGLTRQPRYRMQRYVWRFASDRLK